MACVVQRDLEVEKAFWNEAKGLLVDQTQKVIDPKSAGGVRFDVVRKAMEPEEAIRTIAKTHGLGTDAVGSILANRGGLFQLTNEAWAKQAKLSALKSAAKREVYNANDSPWLKALKFPYEATRRALVIGHGGVIPFTHARNSLFIPGESKMFMETARDAYSYVTPNAGSARWRADMATLRSDPKFNFWARAGLDIKLQSRPVGMGMSRWTHQSFDALKTLRLKLAKKYWDQLDPVDRTLEGAQDLAKRLNHATGVVKSPPIVSKIAGATMFAPKLRFAKYATVVDPFQSPLAAKRFAKLAAVQLGILGINDLVNRYILQSDSNVNWDQPSRPDWLRAKIGGLTIPVAPTIEIARLPFAATAVLLDPKQQDKSKVLIKELSSAVHPGINAIYGGLTGKDLATGAALPFKGVSQYVYGEHRGEKKQFGKFVKDKYAKEIGPGEYASGYAPIPLQPVLKEMARQGVPPDLSEKFIHAYIESILSGLGGMHAYPDVPYKDNP